MEDEEGDPMARKKAVAKVEPKVQVVTYNVGPTTYQIDTDRQKVYRGFVEIETSKAFGIYASWRASNASV